HHFFMSFGEHDFTVVIELPDDDAAAALAMGTSAVGHVSGFKTTKLIAPQQAVAAMARGAKVQASLKATERQIADASGQEEGLQDLCSVFRHVVDEEMPPRRSCHANVGAARAPLRRDVEAVGHRAARAIEDQHGAGDLPADVERVVFEIDRRCCPIVRT
ncbi:MAG: GYD domain-containing protein, partial [Methylobacteriaceae bacterium]|nr:GYD domain-containing protein [Methylobacteriaceae bacterium]